MGSGRLRYGMQPPEMRNAPYGTVIRHREYIGDITGSAAFKIQGAFPINPANPDCFPWLATVAANFEEWVPRGICFEYKSMSSNSVVSTAANAGLGTVIMASQYNPYNPDFTNKSEMENYQWAISTDPSCTAMHEVETARRQNPINEYYTRSGPVPSGADARFYDLAKFFIATNGMQTDGTVIGELWVTYEVELRKPKVSTVEVTDLEMWDHWQIGVSGGDSFSDHPLGTGASLISSSTLRGNISENPTQDIYTFPDKAKDIAFFVSIQWTGTSVTLLHPNPAFNNCELITIFDNDADQIVGTSNGMVGSRACQNFLVKVTGKGATMRWGRSGGNVLPGSTAIPLVPGLGDLVILQTDGSFNR